jgi:hypothetical protein
VVVLNICDGNLAVQLPRWASMVARTTSEAESGSGSVESESESGPGKGAAGPGAGAVVIAIDAATEQACAAAAAGMARQGRPGAAPPLACVRWRGPPPGGIGYDKIKFAATAVLLSGGEWPPRPRPRATGRSSGGGAGGGTGGSGGDGGVNIEWPSPASAGSSASGGSFGPGAGFSVLFSEMDVFWARDPLPALLRPPADGPATGHRGAGWTADGNTTACGGEGEGGEGEGDGEVGEGDGEVGQQWETDYCHWCLLMGGKRPPFPPAHVAELQISSHAQVLQLRASTSAPDYLTQSVSQAVLPDFHSTCH